MLSSRLIVLFLAIHGTVIAQQPANNQDSEKERAATLDVMRRRAMSLEVHVEDGDKKMKAAIIENPLLRYSNPAAQIITPDATVWGWGQQGRPVALASIEKLGCEIVSLTDQPVSATAKSGVKWSAEPATIKWAEVPAAPKPGDTPLLRARQMKEISQKFSATGHYRDTEHLELRLLVTPLHRYSNPAQGLVDGSIFAFAAGTNPEVILLVECRSSDDKKLTWQYAFTRLSAGELEGKLGENVVWTCPPIGPWMKTAPYYSFSFAPQDIIPPGDLPSSTRQ